MLTPQAFNARGGGLSDDAPAFAAMFGQLFRTRRALPPGAVGDTWSGSEFTISDEVHLPSGVYKLGSADFGLGQASASKLRIRGSGADHTRIDLPDGAYFLNIDGQALAIDLADVHIHGGKGAVLLSSSQSTTRLHFRFKRCYFTGFSEAAIAQINASDCGRLHVEDCRFWAGGVGDAVGGIGIAWAGWNDNTVIERCAFHKVRYGLKLGRGNTRSWIVHNSFMRSGAFNGQTDIWIVPERTSANFGDGSVIRENRFGTEYLQATDYRILIADEGAGSSFLTRRHVETASAGTMRRTAFLYNFAAPIPNGQSLVTSFAADVASFDLAGPHQTLGVKP